MTSRPFSLEAVVSKELKEPIRADERYLQAQPLPTMLIRALATHERVYVGGKPYRVKSLGITENGQILGKLEPLEPSIPS